MKTEVLLRSIGKINDELIADAESEANTKRKPGWAKLGIMAACLALVLCTGIATNAIRSNATAGTFTMDVNPSVEYTIAKSGSVKNVRCLNSDAENALSDVALGKQSVETALTRTVAAYEACGYMENGEATVLISFDSRLDANAELKASLSAEIRKALEQTDAVGTLIFHSELTENAEAAKIAEEFHVSLGRADWILTAANKTSLPTDEVARMSLDELLKFQEVSGISSVSVSKFISLEEAKKIALKDAKLDELVQKIVFTREELNRNSGKPCYILEFYTVKKQYSYKVDAKNGSIMEAYHFILLADAKKIALDDAGVSEKVTFTEETLVAGGIKSPYYYFAFESASARWTYKIDAVLGVIMDKTCDKIIPPAPEFIGLEKAKQIALEDAGLDEATQKIVFTREELSRNSGKPCYILEFYTAKKQYSYKVDAKNGNIMEAYHFILLADAKKIELDDAGVNVKVVFTTEELVAGGIKTPYYRFVFADTKTQWTYRIDAVLGTVLEKQQKEIVTTDFISLEEAKQIALKDAGLDEAAQKIVFTREELNRNQGKPCYILEFYTAKKQYSYKVDAKNGNIMEAYHFILLADAKKIALDDAGVSEKVTFTEETLVAGGIKSPYYFFVFESDSARWTYKIDAVLGVIMDKTCDKITPPAPEFIGLEKAKQIALEDAGLDETAQKIVFTREELSRNQGKPCYILEFYTDKCAYSYKVDAVSGDIIGKKTEWFSRQESETVPDTSQNSDSKQRRGN